MINTIKQYTTEGNLISKLSNIASICYEEVTDLNWVGFYIYDSDHQALVLGPFQGKRATSVIPIDQGVCGHAFSHNKVTVVDDVHQFCGHIACDIYSKSELVIPITKDNQAIAVLDIDSPVHARFDKATVEKFKEIVAYIEEHVI